MKRLMLVTVVAALLLSGSALADDILIYDTEESSLVLKQVDTSLQNRDGVDSILFDLVATIKTEEPEWPGNFIRMKVFQGGKTLKSTTIPTAENPYSDLTFNFQTELKNGASEEYYEAFALDSKEDLEIIVNEFPHMDIDYTFYYSIETGEITYDAPEPLPDYKALYEELLEKYEALVGDSDA